MHSKLLPVRKRPISELTNTQTRPSSSCKSYLTLLLEDEEGAVGAITVNNYTNVPSVAPWTWHHWIKKLYGLEATNSWNTVFLHLAVWRKGCDFVFLALLMRQLFVEHYHLEHVVLVAPPGVIEVEWLENVATRILPKGDVPFPETAKTTSRLQGTASRTKCRRFT